MIFGDLDRAKIWRLLTTTPRRPGGQPPTRLLSDKVFGGGNVGIVLLSWDLRVKSVCGLAGTAQLSKPNCSADNLGVKCAIRLDWIGAFGKGLGSTLSAYVTSGRRAFQETNPVPVSAGAEVGENVDQNTRVRFMSSTAAAAAGRRTSEAVDSEKAQHRQRTAATRGSAV
jgi:hypothetical protein